MGAAGLSVPIKAFTEAEDAWTQLQITMMRADGSVAPEFKKISDLATNMGNDFTLKLSRDDEDRIELQSAPAAGADA